MLFSFYEFFLFKCSIYFNLKVDVDDETSIYELPLDVTEYRITDKVRFKLVDIPKGFQVIPSEILIVENAAVQFPNNHIVEVISVRNDN